MIAYKPHVGRTRVYCIPEVGDRLYGREKRVNSSGMICITLPIDLLDVLDEIATATGKTRSELVRQALALLIEKHLQERSQLSQESSEDEKMPLIMPIR